jgi:hypothetical protein
MRITRWALSVSRDKFIVRWAIAWACLAGALGLHVADEALTGFLPFYNSIIVSLRDTYAWVPFPTFTFPVWLGGLITLVIILFALTPLVLRGHRWLRGLSYFLGGIMILNAVGHFLMAVWLGEFAPGVYSSPILLVAAIALLVTTIQSRQADPGIRQ